MLNLIIVLVSVNSDLTQSKNNNNIFLLYALLISLLVLVLEMKEYDTYQLLQLAHKIIIILTIFSIDEGYMNLQCVILVSFFELMFSTIKG